AARGHGLAGRGGGDRGAGRARPLPGLRGGVGGRAGRLPRPRRGRPAQGEGGRPHRQEAHRARGGARRLALRRRAVRAPGRVRQGRARTVLVAGRAAVDKLALPLAAAERAELLIGPLQRRAAADLRWNAQAAARMDGMEVAAMGLSTPELVQLSLWARPGAPALLSEISGGRAVEEMARQRLMASGALGAVLAEPTPEGAVEAGRELTRLWIKATELGLGLHPLGALPGLLC